MSIGDLTGMTRYEHIREMAGPHRPTHRGLQKRSCGLETMTQVAVQDYNDEGFPFAQ